LLANLEKKLFRAEKRKHETALLQIDNVKKRLFPNGALQERTLNIAPMYVNYGEDFLSSCIENFEPLGGDFPGLYVQSFGNDVLYDRVLGINVDGAPGDPGSLVL
jgi:hypothetical protein